MSNNINNKRFSVCNIIKKSEAIELLKNNLTAEELKALIQPNYNHLIKMLKLYSKKDIQYLLYNTHKIGMDKISNIIRKNAVMGGGDSEEEEAEDNNLKKSTTNNLIDMDEEEEEEINTNADLLLANITGVKKMNETAETQTDNNKQLQLEYNTNAVDTNAVDTNAVDTNAVGTKAVSTKSVGNKKETQHVKPTSLKKTFYTPKAEYNEKIVISNDPILNDQIEIVEAKISEKLTAETFMKTDTYDEIKKYKSLVKVVGILKQAKLTYDETEKVCNALTEYHKKRLLKCDKLDTDIKTHIQQINTTSDIYDLLRYI